MDLESFKQIYPHGFDSVDRKSEHIDKIISIDKTVLHTILIVLVFLLLFVQLLKMKTVNKFRKFQSFIQCFDFEQTLSSLVDYTSKNDDISCLYGLKTFACLSILIAHSLFWPFQTFIHQKDGQWYSVKFAVVKEAMLAVLVESFFVMSSIILTRSVLKSLKRGNFNYMQHIVRRYFRTAPILIMILVIDMTLTTRETFHPFNLTCWRNWWKKLLFIGDICEGIGTDSMCLLHTWYLDADFKLSIITPLLIIAIVKCKVPPLKVFFPLMIVSAVYRMIMYRQNLFGNINYFFEDDVIGLQRNTIPFVTTTLRCSTYFIGVIFGIFIERHETDETDKEKSLPSWMKYAAILTGVAAVVPLFIDFSTWMSLENFLVTLSVVQPLHGLCYASFIGFVITMCRFGKSPLINQFLSARFFKTISMLSFSIYMVNPTLKNYYSYNLRIQIDTLLTILKSFHVEMMMTISYAVVMFVLIEEPFRKIGDLVASKLCLEKKKSSEKTS